jgi:hypothetical protein
LSNPEELNNSNMIDEGGRCAPARYNATIKPPEHAPDDLILRQ